MFSDDLNRFGPQSTGTTPSEADAQAYCKQLARQHYENFSVASFLLPKQLRVPFEIVYAYCRWSDDLGDEHDGSEVSRKKSLELFDWWEQSLDNCFAEAGPKPTHPVFIALKSIIGPFQLSKEPFSDLLIAFRRDQIQRRYESFDDLLDYCRYSANPVGRIVLQLAYGAFASPAERQIEHPTERQKKWADSICTGLQLANFWQDVARDAAIGRRYIPGDMAKSFGVDPENLCENHKFRALLAELVQDARTRLRAGVPLVKSVPKPVRVDISLFIRGGLAILDAIEQNGYNVLTRRPVVTRGKKMWLLLAALCSRPCAALSS